MKKLIILCIVLLSATLKANATEWYGVYYEFSHFKYRAEQLLGSGADIPDMYPVAVRLNQYVKELQECGKLKQKPVIYDVYTTIEYGGAERHGKKRYLVEVYETADAYRIHANDRENFMLTFNQKELVRIIDYFASGQFEPFFCDTTMTRHKLSKELLLNRANLAVESSSFEVHDEYEIYSTNGWTIKMRGKYIYVDYGGEELSVKFSYPISKPIIFKERMIIADNNYFAVFEEGKCIKKLQVFELLWDIQTESNNYPKISIYPEWMNIEKDDRIKYSYSYRQNRLYEL